MSLSSLMPFPAGSSAGVSAVRRIRGSCLMRWSRLCMTGGPCIAAAWSITATGAAKAFSIDRRNIRILFYRHDLVQSLCWRSPSEGFSWSAVQGDSNGLEIIGAMLAEICALREILPKQAVGILVAATLPRAMRITEIDWALSVILCAGSYGWNGRTHRYGHRQSVAGPAFGWARAPGAIR
jgi:hypothetical protein